MPATMSSTHRSPHPATLVADARVTTCAATSPLPRTRPLSSPWHNRAPAAIACAMTARAQEIIVLLSAYGVSVQTTFEKLPLPPLVALAVKLKVAELPGVRRPFQVWFRTMTLGPV